MNLRQLITRARILTCELGDTLKKAATTETTGRGLDMTMLEQRVMLSASPIAPVDADLEVQSVATESESAEAATDSTADAVQTDQAEQVQHLVLVDSTVGDHQQLIDAIETEAAGGTEIVLLNSDQDGIEQISEILSRFSNLESLHLVSHGSDGEIRLGIDGIE